MRNGLKVNITWPVLHFSHPSAQYLSARRHALFCQTLALASQTCLFLLQWKAGFMYACGIQNSTDIGEEKHYFSSESSYDGLTTIKWGKSYFEDQMKGFVYIRSSLHARSTFWCIAGTNRTQSNITQKAAVRLQFDCIRQSNRNYSIEFDCVRLVRLQFSFDRVRLTSSGNKHSPKLPK